MAKIQFGGPTGSRWLPPTLGALAATLVLPFLAVPAFADDSENTWNSTAAGNSVYWVDRDSGDVTGLPADMEPEVPEVDGYYTTDCTGSDGDGWQVPDYHPVLRGGLPLAEYRLSIGIANSWYEVVSVHPGDCAPNWVINYPLRLRGVYQYPIAYDASNPAVSGLPADAVEFITYETAWTAADYTIPSNTPANSSGAAFANWNVYQGDTFYGTAEPGDALPFSAVFAAGQGWKLAPVFAGDPDPGTGGDDNGGDNPGDNGDNGDNGDDDDPSGDGTGDGTGDSGHVDGDDDDSGDESDNPGGSDAALRLKKYAVVKVPGATCDWPPTSMYDLLDKDRSEYGNSQKITFDPACVKEIPKGSVIEDGTEITWVYRVYNDGDEDFFPEGDPQITIHDDHEGTCVIETYPDQMPGHTWDLCGITGQPNMSPLGVEAVFPPPSRYYDGTTDADLPNLRLVGAQEGDDVTLDTANTVCKYDHKDASTSRIVTCRNFSLSGADADKYRLPDGYKVTVHNASIIPKPVEYHLDIVKYDDGRDWLTPSTYDAEFNGTWDGLVGQETLNATPEGTFTFDNLVLGPGHSVTGGAVNLADGTGKLSNYDVTITRSGELRYSSIIELTVNATSSNQAITLNRYFNTDNVIVQWNDTAVEGSNDETPLAAAKTHTFANPGTYIVRLVSRVHANPYLPSPSGCGAPLVPSGGTTVSAVHVTRFPPTTDFTSADNAGANKSGANMLCGFNNAGAILDFTVPVDTSWIATAGNNFFLNFNKGGKLTALAADSLNTSNVAGTVGSYFFASFNENGALAQLPAGSLDTSKITAINGNGLFFAYFNKGGQLTSLPEGSFVLDGIASHPQGSFYEFNMNGALTQLPAGSFHLQSTTAAGTLFCYEFNRGGALTSLPTGSFDISNISSIGTGFFGHFNSSGALTQLPTGSFRLNTTVSAAPNGFFSNFNNTGKLTSLPAGSFDISNITTTGLDFFRQFNEHGALTSLPAGSFNTSKITTVNNWVFAEFNDDGKLTQLPAGSFGFESLTSVGTYFLWGFNLNGMLTSIPANSFNLSKITTVGDNFISYFNSGGRITSATSFRFPKLTTAQSGERSFENSFYSTYTLTSPSAMSTIVNGCAQPSTRRGTFTSNQPGYSALDPNWK